MILKNILGALVLSLLTIGLFLFFRTGAHKSVTVKKVGIPEYHFFYAEHVGPYHEIMPKLLMVESKFKELDIECKKTFGLFFSDPDKIDHDRLKSQVGCAFEGGDSPNLFAPIEGISETFFPLPVSNKEELERVVCLSAKFSGSPSLTAMKVYPKLNDKAKDMGLKLLPPTLEVYESSDKDSVSTEVVMCGVK